MYKYRLAELKDMEKVLDMAARFWATMPEQVGVEFDHDSVALLFFHMMEEGLLVVAETDGESPEVVAMIGFTYHQHYVNLSVKTAREVMFWVEPEHRSGGLGTELLAVAGVGLKADDVQSVSMVAMENSPESADHIYRVLGFAPLERAYIKRL